MSEELLIELPAEISGINQSGATPMKWRLLGEVTMDTATDYLLDAKILGLMPT